MKATAEAISAVENLAPAAIDLLNTIAVKISAPPFVIGVTGAPGVGKSTLIDKLIDELRTTQSRVGVISVDPSSSYSGGALLGDRCRMLRHSTDPGVFIRSMASRGCLDGLTFSTGSVVKVMAYAGFVPIILETVGMGQLRCRIRDYASVTLAVFAPGFGDEIQTMKAGLLELADIVVVNKADLPGTDQTLEHLQAEMGHRRLPLHKITASTGVGVPELMQGIMNVHGLSPPPRLSRQVQSERLIEASCQLAAKLLEDAITEDDLEGDQLVSAARLVCRLGKHPLIKAACN